LKADGRVEAEWRVDDVDRVDGIDRGDHALGQAETDGEVLEVLRRRHHHSVGGGVEGKGDRRLLGDGARVFGKATCPPNGTGNTNDGFRQETCSKRARFWSKLVRCIGGYKRPGVNCTSGITPISTPRTCDAGDPASPSILL